MRTFLRGLMRATDDSLLLSALLGGAVFVGAAAVVVFLVEELKLAEERSEKILRGARAD